MTDTSLNDSLDTAHHRLAANAAAAQASINAAGFGNPDKARIAELERQLAEAHKKLGTADRDRDGGNRLDNDTRQNGTEAPFKAWESDHTALVHVLWGARHNGLNLFDDYDEIAARIQRSRWFAAAKHAAAQSATTQA